MNRPNVRKISQTTKPYFTPPATIKEIDPHIESEFDSPEPNSGRRKMKLRRWLSVSVDDLQQLVRTALIAAELNETKKDMSLSTGDNETGGFVDLDVVRTRFKLNKLSLIPVVTKHSFSIDPKDLGKPRSFSCCPANYVQNSFDDPITGGKMTSEEYQILAMNEDVRLNSYEPEWCLNKAS